MSEAESTWTDGEFFYSVNDDAMFISIARDLGEDLGSDAYYILAQCRKPLWWDDASYLAYQSQP